MHSLLTWNRAVPYAHCSVKPCQILLFCVSRVRCTYVLHLLSAVRLKMRYIDALDTIDRF